MEVRSEKQVSVQHEELCHGQVLPHWNTLLCQAVVAMQLGGLCVTDAVFAHGGWVPVLRVKLANAQLRGRSRFIS